MYDGKILNSRTGIKLLNLFDRMEKLMSELYHTTNNDKDDEYMDIIDDIEYVKQIRQDILTKRQRINKSF